MKSRWIVNLVLLLLIVGIVTFLHLRSQPEAEGPKSYSVSALKLSDFTKLTIDDPSKASRVFEKVDGYWYIVQPYKARADQMSIQRILSLVAATTSEKFPAVGLDRFGLDTPRLKIKMNDEEFLFGTFNPVSGEQYIAYKDTVYLLSNSYSDYAAVQTEELIDKNLLKPTEKIAGFDLSHLEQWEKTRLQVDLTDGKWTISVEGAKPDQNGMNEWLDTYWTHMAVKSVEPYTPNHRANYPSFEVKLQDGSRIHFDKLEESPELLLGRPDEGMLYHIQSDVGFSMLNPPLNIAK
ncbi:hypothetical protein A7981_02980 [Methylovorus sp. MM2]|uniref:DUF4340 domain-containing protein n=1 Tax=Methylovorus sp. MM2 TaxID=1848038 RepID=UPI0007DFF55B|nr:DUF4340 domain-containing protein [Methylovorus sp. MM2]OAM52457.1 hypothetical protein A7981_02980 [Methylovorus sp. MM2]